ncbi:hypothetical protein B0T24DRAFT_609257 [Lasiosphaeria ovina]|uniref:Uncharacterized protein n=1 Tax=Lasiosphaeria ovina TaxID=92902 RepID=A0AAE0TYU7_9PEZI|nr:hypothetical protein B0T24DRAFT_609257 [Lasiosphaeria ovina]
MKAFDTNGLSNNMNTWPSITLKRIRYALEQWLYKKRKRRSWIAEFGTFVVALTRFGERLEGSFWLCSFCPDGILFNYKVTSSPSLHLAIYNKFDSN